MKKILGIFIENLVITWLNKLIAIILIAIGMAPMIIEKDITAFILMTFIATPLFFAKENCIIGT